MSEKKEYMTNRIVTEGYLQACERACGPLQGGASGTTGVCATIDTLDGSKFEEYKLNSLNSEYPSDYYKPFEYRDGKHRLYVRNSTGNTYIYVYDMTTYNYNSINVDPFSGTKLLKDTTNFANLSVDNIIETSNQSVIISNTNTNMTMIILNDFRTGKSISTTDALTNFIEDSNKNVYASGPSGVVKINTVDGTVTKIFNNNCRLLRTSNVINFYAFDFNNHKVYKINSDDIFTEITNNSGRQIESDNEFVQGNKGTAFLWRSGSAVIYYVKSSEVTTLHVSEYDGYQKVCLGADGYLYFGGGTRSNYPDFFWVTMTDDKGLQSGTITGIGRDGGPLNLIKNVVTGAVYGTPFGDQFSGLWKIEKGVATQIIDNVNGGNFYNQIDENSFYFSYNSTLYKISNTLAEVETTYTGTFYNRNIIKRNGDYYAFEQDSLVYKDPTINLSVLELSKNPNYITIDYAKFNEIINPYTDNIQYLHNGVGVELDLLKQKEE